jgi:hypothetical protein
LFSVAAYAWRSSTNLVEHHMIKLLVHDWQQMFIIPKPQIWQTVHRSGNAIKDACITTFLPRQTLPGSSTLSTSPWVGLITNAALTPGFWQWKRFSTHPNCLLPRLCFQPSWAKTWCWVGCSMGVSPQALFLSRVRCLCSWRLPVEACQPSTDLHSPSWWSPRSWKIQNILVQEHSFDVSSKVAPAVSILSTTACWCAVSSSWKWLMRWLAGGGCSRKGCAKKHFFAQTIRVAYDKNCVEIDCTEPSYCGYGWHAAVSSSYWGNHVA